MQRPSVLVIHNRYQQPGGEDAVVRAEIDLLRRAGHRVVPYIRDNRDIVSYGVAQKASLLISASWNLKTRCELRSLIRKERPDIAHCHNLLPLVSPAAYYECKANGVPVVQTLHNYRLCCPAGTLFTRGERCRRPCRGSAHAIASACYRNSHLQTAAVSLMLSTHSQLDTWERCVDAYVVPSAFCRDYFAAAGLPQQKLHVKSNFLVNDPGKQTARGDYALFVGRLSAEKGVLEMLEAWRDLPEVKLLVIGDGPLFAHAQDLAHCDSGKIKFLGQLEPARTMSYMRGARFLVFPSRWYEPFGMGLLEAAACGVPAVASHIGAIPELVSHRRTGLLFKPDDLRDMAECVRWAWMHPAEMEEMGVAARRLYLEKFTADMNYEALMKVYRKVLSV